MTVIVAVQKGDQVVMAHDSHSFLGTRVFRESCEEPTKVQRLGDTLVGVAGWAVYSQLIQELGDKQEWPFGSIQEVHTFMRAFWSFASKEAILVNPQCNLNEQSSPFADLDSTFLFANKHGIFYVTPGFSVSRIDRFTSIGSGQEYALGAMHTCYDSFGSAEQVARAGVEAALHFDTRCAGEAILWSLSA